jgi:chlorobactene glucosyltransferase
LEIDSFLGSIFNLYQFPFLSVLFSVVLSSWVYLNIISLKSHFAVPAFRTAISNSLTTTRSSHRLSSKSITSNTTLTIENFSNELPFLSIIVPARNEEQNIENCIKSLLTQNYPHFEVIAVDDNSTDNTLEILMKIKEKISQSEPSAEQSLPSSASSLLTSSTSSTSSTSNTILHVISLKDKPHGWKGKTWAMQQGYLQSKGDILLFTDADTTYISSDAIISTLTYMLRERLDALTSIFFSELRDFISKTVMPLWDIFSLIFGRDASKMNDPRSKVAYLLGAFIMIKKEVLEDIGTFDSVRDAIQEDKVLGEHLKYGGFKVRIIKAYDLISALWSRDAYTLWYGIERTLAPIIKDNVLKVLWNLLIMFFMALLPFLLLPYTIWLSAISREQLILFGGASLSYGLFLFYLNSSCCIIIVAAIAAKNIARYNISPLYSAFAALSSFFLTIAYVNALLKFGLNHQKPIPWRGRKTQA